MPTLSDYANLCDHCVYAPCICGNDPDNCASYIQKHGYGRSYGERKDGETDVERSSQSI